MKQLAAPGSILVTEQTHKLTAGYFEFKPLGKTQVKGVGEPLNIYEVISAGPLRTRLQVAARRGLTRFVGRHSEMEQMRQALDQAKAGHGQVVGVMGEPGVGKSRLFHEFVGAVREPPLRSQSGCLVLEAYSVSYGKASPYLPLIELLKTYFQIQPQGDERQRQEKITGKVLTLDRSLEETLPYLFSLLGIEDQTSSFLQMDARVRRRRTFEALKKLFLRESLNQPLILVFEDLHWLDSETAAFLTFLCQGVASAKLLLLVNYRPEYRHEWGQKTYHTQLRLAPLGKEEAEELLTFLLGNDESLKALKQLILEKTDGTPFFIEEVVQTLAEEGALVGEQGSYRLETTPTALHISPTVQGVLTARIDRLPPVEKAFLRQLAVMGREFPLSLVKHVVTQPEEDLYRLLSSLQRKEFLYEQPAFPEAEYIFKHALTQEVAYGTVLQDQRKALHERTGQAIEALYKDKLDDHYSELAHHYGRSGNTEKAVAYLSLASHQAVQRSANAEAIGQLTTALELLQTLPDTPERTQQELALQIALGVPLIATRGWAAPETTRAYSRARELCAQIGETPQLFPVLYGLYQVYISRAAYQRAHELGEQLFILAQRQHDPALLLVAQYARGLTSYHLGEFARAREHLEQGLALYDSQQHRVLAFDYGQDFGVSCLFFTALALWHLGYPDQAVQKSDEARTLVQELTHPFSQAAALALAVTVHQLRREEQAAHEQANVSIAVGTERGIPSFLAWGTLWRGWALAAQGQTEEGIAQMRQGLAAWRATGAENLRSHFLALLAEACGKAGQAEEGWRVLAEALDIARETGERCYEPELHRLKGELSLQQSPGNAPQAESCFQNALNVARQQAAKSWELRAVTSLARLWQSQGKTTEARALLAPVYNWFTEGFDTKDLQEAKMSLEELAEAG